MMVSIPKISIIIPIYNVGNYLRECLDSVIHQSLNDIEIVCVNDASPDNCADILREYARQDNRIKVIQHLENKGTSQARKNGVILSSGEYIMFVDPDDSLEFTACEELYTLIKLYNVEILHFGMQLIQANSDAEKNLLPYAGKLENQAVFKSCFIEHKYNYSMVNKIFQAGLCKKAFQHVSDGYFPKAQDFYAYFIIAFFARSFYGVPEKILYHYNFGRGITGRNSIDLSIFKKYCQRSRISREIKKFLTEQNSLEEYASICNDFHKVSIKLCVTSWFRFLETDYAEGFDLMIKTFGVNAVVSALASEYFDQPDIIAHKIMGAASLKSSRHEIKTIAVFYHHISIGGVQRMLSNLMPVWMNMGYQIVFFTNEPPGKDDYPLPDGIKRIILPACGTKKPVDYSPRAKLFSKALQENNVDILLHYAGSSTCLLFDLILTKSSGIPCIVGLNELFSSTMTNLSTYNVTQKPYVLRLADLVVVLSNLDKKYWRIMGVNAEYLPAPLTFNLEKTRCSNLDNQNVVWVGRFDRRSKRYLDAVRIFAAVVARFPEARLFMVGDDVTLGATASLQDEISRLKLDKNVLLCGYSQDVRSYYSVSSINLVTSIFESFSIVISESKSFGLPCVLYKLPYLELLKDGLGYIAVEQGDIKAAANAIISLLSDTVLLKKTGRDARQSIEVFSKFDIGSAWKTVFDRVITSPEETRAVIEGDEKDMRLILETILFHYSLGCKMHQTVQSKLKRLTQDNPKA